jgi:hypothetical protein
MRHDYPPEAYDVNFCLKVSPALWAALAFLCRPYVVMIMSWANRRNRMQLIEMFYSDRSAFALAALGAIPTLVLIIAYIQRRPSGGPSARWVWHHGRALLLTSALINMAIALWPMLNGSFEMSNLDFAQLFVSVLITYYALTSQRVKDTFADFPDYVEPESEKDDDDW